MHLELPPGGSFEMPEILIQSLPQGQPHLAAPALHRFCTSLVAEVVRLRSCPFAPKSPTSATEIISQAEARAPADRSELPVVYNTWFDQFEVLEVPRLAGSCRRPSGWAARCSWSTRAGTDRKPMIGGPRPATGASGSRPRLAAT